MFKLIVKKKKSPYLNLCILFNTNTPAMYMYVGMSGFFLFFFLFFFCFFFLGGGGRLLTYDM